MTITIPQRILIAPSGFKESLDAAGVARAIAAGLRRVIPGVQVDEYPVPDGGEGTAAELAAATGGELVPARGHRPGRRSGHRTLGPVGWFGDRHRGGGDGHRRRPSAGSPRPA